MTTSVDLPGQLTAEVEAPPSIVVTTVSSGTPTPVPVAVPATTVAPVAAPGTPTASVSFTSGPSVSGWGSRVDQSSPSASWDILVPASIDRVPAVSIYLATGELVLADVVATASHVYITFPFPVAGFVILT
jgi:hypothetical protein